MANRQETLCWTCRNAYAGKCCWIDRCEPVKGWTAKRSRLKISDGKQVNTWHVTGCPNYIRDVREPIGERRRCPICRQTFVAKSLNQIYCGSMCRDLGRMKIL